MSGWEPFVISCSAQNNIPLAIENKHQTHGFSRHALILLPNYDVVSGVN